MTKPAKQSPPSPDPPPGQYLIFHHVYVNQNPKLYKSRAAPEIKGAFVHFVSEDGEELWLSGNLTVKPVRIRYD